MPDAVQSKLLIRKQGPIPMPKSLPLISAPSTNPLTLSPLPDPGGSPILLGLRPSVPPPMIRSTSMSGVTTPTKTLAATVSGNYPFFFHFSRVIETWKVELGSKTTMPLDEFIDKVVCLCTLPGSLLPSCKYFFVGYRQILTPSELLEFIISK